MAVSAEADETGEPGLAVDRRFRWRRYTRMWCSEVAAETELGIDSV
jgi:hypothetical protein